MNKKKAKFHSSFSTW